MTWAAVTSVTSNLINLSGLRGQEKRTETLAQLQTKGLEAQVLPTAHPALAEVYYKIDWLIEILVKGEYPNFTVRAEIISTLQIYMGTALPKIPSEGECKSEEDRNRRKKIEELQSKISTLIHVFKQQTFPKGIDEITSTLNLLQNDIFPILQQEFRRESGFVAQVAHVFFSTLKKSCGIKGINAYELGKRAQLLSHPALDQAHADLQKIKEMSKGSFNRQEIAQKLRQIKNHLLAQHQSTVEHLCSQLEDESSPLSETLIEQTQEILNQALQQRQNQKSLKEAYHAIHQVREEGSHDKTISKKTRLSLIQHLENFTQLYPQLKEKIEPLILVLKSKATLHSPDNQQLIDQVFKLISHEYQNGAGWPEIGIDLIITKITRYAESKIGSKLFQSKPDLKNEFHRTLLDNLETTPPELKPEPIDILADTRQQLNIFKDKLSKIVVGHTICWLFNIPSEDEQGDWLLSRIQKTLPISSESNSEKSLEMELYERIDQAEISWVKKGVAKFIFRVLEIPIYYYVSHYITILEKNISIWIHLDPKEQLDKLAKVVLDPLADYFTTLIDISSKFKRKVSEPAPRPGFLNFLTDSNDSPYLTQEITTTFENEVKTLQKNPKTPFSVEKLSRKLSDQLIHHIFSQAPSDNWADEASQYYQHKKENNGQNYEQASAQTWSNFHKNTSPLFKAVQFIKQSCLRMVLRLGLRIFIKKQMTAFFHSPKKEITYIHNLHKVLQENLKKLNQEAPSNQAFQEEESIHGIPKAIGEKIFKVLDLFRQVINKQSTLGNVEAFIDGKESVFASYKQSLQGEALAFAKPLILKQIFPFLQKITNKELLQKSLLNILTHLNSTNFSPKADISSPPPHAIEASMHAELAVFFRKKVASALNDMSEPHLKQNQIIVSYFERFKKRLSEMVKIFESLDTTSEKIHSCWSEFNDWRSSHTDSITESLPLESKNKILEINIAFNHQCKTIFASIKTMKEASKENEELSKIIAKFEEISSLTDATLAPWKNHLRWLEGSLLSKENSKEIIEEIRSIIKASNQPDYISTTRFPTLKKLIENFLNKDLLKRKENSEKKLQNSRNSIKQQAINLSKWFSEQKTPEVEKQTSPTAFLMNILLKNRTVQEVLVLVAENNSSEILEFLKKDYHSIFLQYLLKGLLELPPISEAEKQKALRSINISD